MTGSPYPSGSTYSQNANRVRSAVGCHRFGGRQGVPVDASAVESRKRRCAGRSSNSSSESGKRMTTRPPRSPRTIRLLNVLESVYTDTSLPTVERIAAAALTGQLLGHRVDILLSGQNLWRDALVRIRGRIHDAAKQFPRPKRKRRKPRDVEKALQEIRKFQNEES